jgi:hypothetical protein
MKKKIKTVKEFKTIEEWTKTLPPDEQKKFIETNLAANQILQRAFELTRGTPMPLSKVGLVTNEVQIDNYFKYLEMAFLKGLEDREIDKEQWFNIFMRIANNGISEYEYKNARPILKNEWTERILIKFRGFKTSVEDWWNMHKRARPEQKQPENFSEIFIVPDYEKYIEPLTKCKPQLLKKEKGKYKFIGNQKTQRGCVAQWFKFLKNKGIINQSVNRDELAAVLSTEIENYSIDGSSIDNQSKTYTVKFEKQLKEFFNNIN